MKSTEITDNIKYYEDRKLIFKKLYTIGQFLYLADISPKNEILDNKIKELEKDLQDEFLKKPRILKFVEKLSQKKHDSQNEEEGKGLPSNEILKELRIFTAIDYVLIANYLIIDKADALIKDLEGKENITYEEVIQHLNRILKAKSTVDEVSIVKKMLKNRILVPIIRRKGPTPPTSRKRILNNCIKLRQKFVNVLYPETDDGNLSEDDKSSTLTKTRMEREEEFKDPDIDQE
ncbi:unnamed protein product [Moneuplotes crassus]|uniref:Uncharacterized protein n=1 Tax=Euplotes crassus TaxID=5936 RepID=A0AAD2D044_EUPCR|nr:unnamed protein product [Moneuplotes crassus]